MIWSLSWSRTINGVDVETNADLEAISATDAVKSFISMFPEVAWKNQKIRAEKNYTYFIFIVENYSNNWFEIKLRRI